MVAEQGRLKTTRVQADGPALYVSFFSIKKNWFFVIQHGGHGDVLLMTPFLVFILPG